MEETKNTKRKTLSGERISAIQNILFPYGCSQLEDGNYMVGASPSIEGDNNIIGLRVRLDDEDSDADFELILLSLGEGMSNKDLYGYYCGIMSILVPNACPIGREFNSTVNVLQFCICSVYGEEGTKKGSMFEVLAKYDPF